MLLIVVLAAMAGIVIGLGAFTFSYGKGYAYLSNDPKACVNCHIMRDQYDSWRKSSHHNVTTCNSCHSPTNLVMKYVNKAENGFMHSWKFTFGNFKEPIRIRPHNFNVAMNSCMNCHGELLKSTFHRSQEGTGQSCVQCHRNVGHTH